MTDAAAAIPGGERIGDFQILGKLGAGGMGVVYKATDLRLERTVALKFLPAELSVEENEKALLVREAKAASALDHNNIGVIHGLEETADGKLFIVMGFYDGETLAAKIRRGPLKLAETLDIAIQVARGLSEAHARHIVHRDIKPSNIIITDRGVAKIVDFGLARVISSASSQQSIRTSGTAAYMSPEQAMGKTLDHRTDVWSLGVVLVEMATGMVGHLLAWERHERDGSWWAWVSWVQETGGRHHHKVVQVRADSLRPLEAPEAYQAVPRQLRGLDGQIRRLG